MILRVTLATLGLACWAGALAYQNHPLQMYLHLPILGSLALTLGWTLLWWPRYHKYHQGAQRWARMAWRVQLQATACIALISLWQMLYQLELAPHHATVGPTLRILLLLPLYLGLIRLWILQPGFTRNT